MLLEICLEKNICKIHFFPPFLIFGPQAFSPHRASPAPSRGLARTMRPASPARLPLARCAAQHRRRPNIATTAAPPLSPAADARAPPVGAVPFLPRGSEPPAPGAATTVAHNARRGSVPLAPRPRFKGAEPLPVRSPALPTPFSHSCSRHGGHNRRTEELHRPPSPPSASPSSPSRIRP